MLASCCGKGIYPSSKEGIVGEKFKQLSGAFWRVKFNNAGHIPIKSLGNLWQSQSSMLDRDGGPSLHSVDSEDE
jgi:hypothetical protein